MDVNSGYFHNIITKITRTICYKSDCCFRRLLLSTEVRIGVDHVVLGHENIVQGGRLTGTAAGFVKFYTKIINHPDNAARPELLVSAAVFALGRQECV